MYKYLSENIGKGPGLSLYYQEMSTLRAIFLSLILHLVLLILFQLFPPQFDNPQNKNIQVEIVDRPLNTSKSKLVVRDTENTPDSELDDEVRARFLSAQRKRVLLETKARLSGLTRNQDPLKPKPQWHSQGPKKINPLKEIGGIQSGSSLLETVKENQKSIQSDAPSTVGEALPQDISVGNFTALNTDRFTYYSFFSRVEELVRFRWESKIHNALDSFDRHYLNSVVGNRNWITQVEFLLDKEGKLVRAILLKESGIKKFDLACLNSFREANVFPNPPKELIEEDGYVHLRYSFNVYYNPGSLAGSQ